jgi:ABC-type uncharacterized transport system YnjBCD ATPase subunit
VSKAILLNLGVYLADNGIRRSIASFAYNFTSPSSNVVNTYLTLNPGEVFTWVTPSAVTAATLVSCSGPLKLDITLPAAVSYTITANKVHLVDSDVRQVVIKNEGATAVNLVLIQS